MSLHVVLVQPEIPQNTGNVARTCAAVGADLHLVHPLGFDVDDKSVRRAGLDYWHLLKVHHYQSLDEFLAMNRDDRLVLFSAHGRTAHTAVKYHDGCYLVFGRETRGLPDSLLESDSGPVVRIPVRGESRCLNLSNAVAVGVYEALRQQHYPGLTMQPQDNARRQKSMNT